LTRRKIVQTELEMREYEAFRRVVEKRGLTINRVYVKPSSSRLPRRSPLKRIPYSR